MKVYLLYTGCYEDRGVVGVYATPDAAMAAHQPEQPADHRGVRGNEYGRWAGTPWSYEWKKDEDGESWHFDADWDDSASVEVEEVRS